jgi:DEAD/DEAH box helicase domain-containing protein
VPWLPYTCSITTIATPAAPSTVTAPLDELVVELGGLPSGPGGDRLVHLERLAPRPARPGTLARPLPPPIEALGEGLWSHQAEAVDLARAGRSVVVATGTASGKSRCYQLPIAEAVLDRVHPGTALCLFPTKALAQDQLRAFGALDVPGLAAATYDGDAGREERAWARAHANVVLTNPEMLHGALLPHHARWATFFMRLRYVVIDELHVLRGIFGTHVAHLLRRLRRVADHYGADPTFIFSSATIGEPARLATELCGRSTTAVTDDGSPRGERLVALWNPPRVTTDDEVGDDEGETVDDDDKPDTTAIHHQTEDRQPTVSTGTDGPPVVDRSVGRRFTTNHDTTTSGTDTQEQSEVGRPAGRRRSTGRETATLTAQLVIAGHRTIAFCRSRKGTEVVARDIAGRLPAEDADLVRPYRGGYLAEERREIEADLFSGRLRAVVATTALELGVDIGGLDACVLNGFPGTVSSMWQQVGRAGREGAQSLAVVVAGDDQLDQWLLAHPGELFSRPPEPAVINPSNPYVLHPHLACAAFEMPLTHDDERWWDDLLADGVRDLVATERLRIRPRRRGGRTWPTAVWCGDGWPAHGIGLRGGSSTEYRIVTPGPDGADELVGTVDESRAFSQVHPGAVYLHRGGTYRVADLDIEDRTARVEPMPDDEYTRAKSDTDITILETSAARTVGRSRLSLGSVEVTTQVTGYERREVGSGDLLGREHLDLPRQHLVTRGFWYTVDEALLEAAGIEPEDGPGALHAIEHAAIAMLPLFTICDRWDVGGVSTMRQGDTGLPTIVIYDGYPGGAGIAELGFDVADRHLVTTLQAIEACPCADGCPSCVQSPKCGNLNEPLDKHGAERLLRVLLERAEPDQPEPEPDRQGLGLPETEIETEPNRPDRPDRLGPTPETDRPDLHRPGPETGADLELTAADRTPPLRNDPRAA